MAAVTILAYAGITPYIRVTPGGVLPDARPGAIVWTSDMPTLEYHGYHPPYQETPERFARALAEMLRGHREPPPALTTFPYEGPPQLVASYGNQAYCLCPHHLLAVELICSIGYVVAGEPGGSETRRDSSGLTSQCTSEYESPVPRILGLSKIPRLIRWAASRLITQEDLVADLHRMVTESTSSTDVFIHIKGSHSCMRARGARSNGLVETFLGAPSSPWKDQFLHGLPT